MSDARADEQREAASDFLSYVIYNGEADPDGPMSDDIADAIKRYDGSSESEDRIWYAYRSALRED